MTLMKESEKNKKKQTNAPVAVVLSVVGVLVAFLITLLFTENFGQKADFESCSQKTAPLFTLNSPLCRKGV